MSPSSPRAASPASTSALRSWPAGDTDGARREWREVERREPDSPAAVRADDILHPEFAPGRPPFVAPLEAPPGLEGLTPQEQLDELERRAAAGGVEEKLAYGIALQRVGRPLSAREAFEAAAAADPDDLPARVAAAIGRFDKDDPSQTFSRLGPLASGDDGGVVRYHLGLALSWIGQVEEAKRQLRPCQRGGPERVLRAGSPAAARPSRECRRHAVALPQTG